MSAGIPATITDAQLKAHPLAIWIETRLGIEWEGSKWIRARPQTLRTATQRLADDSGLPLHKCEEVLRQFLMTTSLAEADRLLRPTVISCGQFTLFEGERSAVSHSRMG